MINVLALLDLRNGWFSVGDEPRNRKSSIIGPWATIELILLLLLVSKVGAVGHQLLS